jgi:IclR family KDG regulon transcriptional repressor
MENPRLFLKSLARGFQMLDTVCSSPVSFGLSELAKECGFNISHIQRLSYTLQEIGIIDRDPKTKKFRIGPKMIALAAAVMKNMELKKIAFPIMSELCNEIKEVVGLGVLTGNDVVLIESILNTAQILNVSITPGDRVPVHATALGKTILAYLPPTEADAFLESYKPVALTPNTINSISALKNQLKKIRESGFAEAYDESTYGLSALAAPVRDSNGRVVAALAIMIPTIRAKDDSRMKFYLNKLLIASNQISFAIGYRD